MHCLNCGQLVSENFCSVCGQKTTVKRISIKALLHDLPHSLFHVDKGILKNIKGITNPHDTVFGYMEGKRISYFSPFLFFLITTTAVLLFTYFFPMWFLKIDLFLFYCTDSLSHLILFERVKSDQQHTNDDAAAPHIAVT